MAGNRQVFAGLIALAALLSPGVIPRLGAQTPTEIYTHPELYVRVQDELYIKRIQGNDTIPEERMMASAAYQFEMIYDSTCRVSYLFSECRHNGIRPRLLSWRNMELTTASARILTDSSRTEAFTLTAGDSISFYRELRWYDPRIMQQNTDNFFSPDTVDYAVELVNATDGARLALLDSLGALASPTPAVPVLYGTRPIIALVRYTVPSSMGGKSAFVRVRLSARGSGLYDPVRRDMPTIAISRSLESPNLEPYLSAYGGGLGKRALERLSDEDRLAGDAQLVINWISSDEVGISIDPSESSSGATVAVYDILGNPVFIPFATRSLTAPASLRYRFPSAGIYLIALIRDGNVVAVRKITTSR